MIISEEKASRPEFVGEVQRVLGSGARRLRDHETGGDACCRAFEALWTL